MDFQTSIIWDFAYLISPYQTSKNERNLNFKLSPPSDLESKLYELGNYDDGTVIKFSQWTSTCRANLISCRENVPLFKTSIIEQLEKLTPHSFIARCQSNYLREPKGNLEENEVIIPGDFAKNYSFVVQDKGQGFHWNNLQCILHPVVVFFSFSIKFFIHFTYKTNIKLNNKKIKTKNY